MLVSSISLAQIHSLAEVMRASDMSASPVATRLRTHGSFSGAPRGRVPSVLLRQKSNHLPRWGFAKESLAVAGTAESFAWRSLICTVDWPSAKCTFDTWVRNLECRILIAENYDNFRRLAYFKSHGDRPHR